MTNDWEDRTIDKRAGDTPSGKKLFKQQVKLGDIPTEKLFLFVWLLQSLYFIFFYDNYIGLWGFPNAIYHIYPNPPLRQDMTQGQFLSGV